MNTELVNNLQKVFEQEMPLPQTELIHENPYELAVATILSAQCTDKRVNMITPAFFEKFPTVQNLANATQEEVFEKIKSCSYPNNKAKNLLAMAKTVVEKYNGNLPDDRDELQTLPGIGRKTANVIATVAFGKQTMPVDTHVFRVSQRIGLVSPSKSPNEVEKKLLEVISAEKLHDFHHWLILHGRNVCKARKPLCEGCSIAAYCKFNNP